MAVAMRTPNPAIFYVHRLAIFSLSCLRGLCPMLMALRCTSLAHRLSSSSASSACTHRSTLRHAISQILIFLPSRSLPLVCHTTAMHAPAGDVFGLSSARSASMGCSLDFFSLPSCAATTSVATGVAISHDTHLLP